LPPRVRDMWLLMTMRLSIISLAGMVRTLVAVGTVSDWSMFAARVLGMPRSGVTFSCSSAGAASSFDCGLGAWAGMGACLAGLAVVRATGCAPITGIGAVTGLIACVGADCDDCAAESGVYFSRIGHHSLSTELRSCLNCTYSSSTSHELAPNPPSPPTPVTWFDTLYRPLSSLKLCMRLDSGSASGRTCNSHQA